MQLVVPLPIPEFADFLDQLFRIRTIPKFADFLDQSFRVGTIPEFAYLLELWQRSRGRVDPFPLPSFSYLRTSSDPPQDR